MKLLLDQNLSPKLLENLDRSYPESHHVQELALEKNEDNQLWF
jgi:predicted nuclease of predicted toxin-antitoxin system